MSQPIKLRSEITKVIKTTEVPTKCASHKDTDEQVLLSRMNLVGLLLFEPRLMLTEL